MIIPIRCFTCNKVIANKWKTYESLMNTKMSQDAIFEKIGIEKYCCKRMFVTHVELIDELLLYSDHIDENGKKQTCLPPTVTLNKETDHPRIYQAV